MNLIKKLINFFKIYLKIFYFIDESLNILNDKFLIMLFLTNTRCII